MSEAELILDEGEEVIVYKTKTGAPSLSDREAKEFAELAHIVVEKLGFFVEVGLALQRIRDSRLYREDHFTFEEYVKDAFDMSARRSEQLRQAAITYNQIRTNCSPSDNAMEPDLEKRTTGSCLLPKNEGQVRALLRAPEEKRADIWRKAVERAGGDKVTARHVANVIREEGAAELQEKVEKQKRESRKDGQELYKPFIDAFDALQKQVVQAYLDDWKNISKKDVVRHLQVIIDYIDIH